ncbi:MAG: hypothetical protein JWM58_1374 [Rhizobium sp.]|nr:hypothetical protein [Rhizobium sp.]
MRGIFQRPELLIQSVQLDLHTINDFPLCRDLARQFIDCQALMGDIFLQERHALPELVVVAIQTAPLFPSTTKKVLDKPSRTFNTV